MERILVSMDSRKSMPPRLDKSREGVVSGFMGALYRAIHLAERINAAVHVLVVLDGEEGSAGQGTFADREDSVRQGLDLLVEKGRSDGVRVNCYIAHGDYEEEVIRFVKENRISMLVLGVPDTGSGDTESLQKFDKSLRRIRQGIDCMIELVQRKGDVVQGAKIEKSSGS
jgi:nucleotide-binding universal stress UspA family protein